MAPHSPVIMERRGALVKDSPSISRERDWEACLAVLHELERRRLVKWNCATAAGHRVSAEPGGCTVLVAEEPEEQEGRILLAAVPVQ